MCVGGGGWWGGGGWLVTQSSEISKVRNSISYESLKQDYLLAFLFSIRIKEEEKKKKKSDAKNLCVCGGAWGGRGHSN